MSVLAAKKQELNTKTAEAVALRDKIAEAAKAGTPFEDDQKAFDTIMDVDVVALQAEIKRLTALEAIIPDDEPEPAPQRKTGEGLIGIRDRFVDAPTLGEQLVNSEQYKSIVKKAGGAGAKFGPGDVNLGVECKGFLQGLETKDTFNLSGTGLDSSRNYLGRSIEVIQQQQPSIRDLLAVGQTTQNIVYWIKESSYTNGADMVAEEGQKPEASFATTTANAPVKKIAVVAKVTEEMWSDFPMLRDYVNMRLMFMVKSKEDDQLLNGTGSGNQITGILQTSGIQTQAKGGDTNLDAIHKAMVKIRTPTTGGYVADGIVMNPTDYQLIRLAKDGQNQYYGGGPFYGAYGNGNTASAEPGPWGLRVVQTTAIAAGTALVGAFATAAQLWQREGFRVDSTNTNEDDFNFNRISLRVEERLALAVYQPGAFCTVTSIA